MNDERNYRSISRSPGTTRLDLAEGRTVASPRRRDRICVRLSRAGLGSRPDGHMQNGSRYWNNSNVAGSAPVCAVAGLPRRGPEYPRRVVTDTTPDGREGISPIKLGETTIILDLHGQGLSVSAAAKQIGYGSQECAQVRRAGARGSEIWPTQAKHNVWRPARDLSSRTREGLSRPDRAAAFPRDLGSRPFLQLHSAIRADKVTGLETGARNYITKPFASPEYLARVRAALRGPPEASLQQDFPFRCLANGRRLHRGTDCKLKLSASSLF